MKAAAYRIASDNPKLPLIDWYLFLFDKADIARQRFHGRLTWGAIKTRLLKMRGAPAQPDIAEAADLLPDPSTILFLDRVLSFIDAVLDLRSNDPAFPWREAHNFEYALAPEALPWRMREQARFLTGAYAPVPWNASLPPIPGHFTHLSNDNPALIAFTDTDAKGEADVQTRMKPGRYLAKFYPALAPHEVRDIQETMPRTTTLYFAVTADDIERVYTTGPTSCMSHCADHFESPCHPVRVYGESDLQLAYIKNEPGLPVARALVWPEKKRYGRIYGHEQLLRQQLQRAGYEPGSLRGARIRRIDIDTDDSTVVLPYIDVAQSFDLIDGQWLAIGGPYSAATTDGVGRLCCITCCQHCECDVPEDDACTVGGQAWCHRCRDEYAFTSDYSGEDFPDHESATVITHPAGATVSAEWSISERDDHATYCDGSDAWYATDDFAFVRLKNGHTWLASYFAEHGDPADLDADNDNPSADSTEGRAAA